MIVLLIALSAAAAVVSFGTAVFVPAVFNAVASFWSNGVMANYRSEPMAAPGWATVVSMLTAALSLALIVAGFLLK